MRGISEESSKAFVEDQTRNFTNSTEEFAKIVNAYCQKNHTRVVFLMDEVGQFIGDNTQLMLNLQTCVEDLGKYCHGQAWVVVTSQQELKAMIDSTKDKQQDFSKIQGRFSIRLLLSGANADEVIKERILKKKDNAVTPLRALYDANASRLSNLILFPAKPTWSGYHDADEFAAVYPFASYQFELLQKVFEAIREHGMSEGRHLSQNERSLLDAFQTSAKNCMEQDIGLLVPFDSFYLTIEQFIDYDIKTVFINAEHKPTLDQFDIRVLRILFMIKHVKDMPATIDRLATLMADSIFADKGALKAHIAESLKRLEGETLIQKDGEVYEFLTNAERDVNIQIINTPYNQAEVQRTILDIIYDKIFEGNKYRYEGRYDFTLNRYVDDECKGSISQTGLTVRIRTQFSGTMVMSDFQAETIRDGCIVIDLTEGTFVSELILANKIATYKRINSATMSAALAEIMTKKTAEISDRTKRAEDLIRVALKTAPIYLAGTMLDIRQKDGKDRMLDALKDMVKRDYFNIGLVVSFYSDQRSIFSMLSESDISLVGLNDDDNKGAYKEIMEKLGDDKRVMRTTTVKSLLDYFSKKPYGWRDLDILGMVGRMWKFGAIQILIHDNVIDTSNTSFKNDLARKNNVDTMVVRVKEVIDEVTLYKVKRIMNDTFSVNLPLTEKELKDGVVTFFQGKKAFLAGLRSKQGTNYVGAQAAAEISRDIPLLFRAKRAVIIGDPMQLQHISQLTLKQDKALIQKYGIDPIWSYSSTSLYGIAVSKVQQQNIIQLRDHFRSCAEIIEYSNETFYDGSLRTATAYSKLKVPTGDKPGIRWIHTEGKTIRPTNGSAFNPEEVSQVINELRRLVAAGYTGTIGVTTPFRMQAEQIMLKLKEEPELLDKLVRRYDFLADTVHKFQGDERDLMIFSSVVTNNAPAGTVGFLEHTGNLFNVAVTRARSVLVVVGDYKYCISCEIGYLRKFAAYYDKLMNGREQANTDWGMTYTREYPSNPSFPTVSEWEKVLYTALFDAGIQTIPQYPADRYSLDLALILPNGRKLDIEVDGEMYHRQWNKELSYRDQLRNQRMIELGWDVKRFWVYQVRDELPWCVSEVKKWYSKLTQESEKQ